MSGDWMKNPVFMAEAGHLLAGWLVVLLFSFFGGRRAVGVGVLLFGLYALVKEYYVDLRFESGETEASSTLDFAFYMVGVGLALASIALRNRYTSTVPKST